MFDGDDDDPGGRGDPEDFFQFLERTSTSRARLSVPPTPLFVGVQKQRTKAENSQSTVSKAKAEECRGNGGGGGGGGGCSRLQCFVVDAPESGSSCSVGNSEPSSSVWGAG